MTGKARNKKNMENKINIIATWKTKQWWMCRLCSGLAGWERRFAHRTRTKIFKAIGIKPM